MKLSGVVPALFTPLTPDERIDLPSLDRLIEHVIAGGVSGIFILGTCGEGATLTVTERKRLIKHTVKRAAGRVPVISGVFDTGTRRVQEQVAVAAGLGTDAVVVLPPFFYRQPDRLAVIEYYNDVAAVSPVPVIGYNNPSVCGIKLSLPDIKDISAVPNVCGFKDSSGDIRLVNGIIRQCARPGFFVFCGPEGLYLRGLKTGLDGMVSGFSNLVPDRVVGMYAAAKRNDWAAVTAYQQELDALIGFLGNSTFRAIKYALHLAGLCGPHMAEPQPRLATGQKRVIRSVLNQLGLLSERSTLNIQLSTFN